MGGSLASSLHGIPRATQDADVVAGIEPRHVVPLVAAFREVFYLDEGAVDVARTERGADHLWVRRDDPTPRTAPRFAGNG